MKRVLGFDMRTLNNYRLVHGRLEKRCTGCHRWLKRRDFHARKKSSDGLNSWCKVCINQARDSRRETHAQRIAREIRQLSGLREVNKLRTISQFTKLAHRLYNARVSYAVTHPRNYFCQVEIKLPQTIGGYEFKDIDTLARYIEGANQ